MPDFGTRLKSAMLTAGVKGAKELAVKAGVSPQVVRRWLSNTEPHLSAKHLLQVAKVLHVRAHWLGSGEGPANRFHANEYNERELLQTFRNLNNRERVLLRDIMGIVLKFKSD